MVEYLRAIISNGKFQFIGYSGGCDHYSVINYPPVRSILISVNGREKLPIIIHLFVFMKKDIIV